MGVEFADNPLRLHADWSDYPYVMIGADLAAECVQAQLPRRSGIVLVHLVEQDSADRMSSGTGDWERDLWRSAVKLGAENVVGLPAAEFWLRDALTASQSVPVLAPALAPEVGSEQIGDLIAVIPGSGGAGASTLAVNLGFRAVQQGKRALLIDADPRGGGVDLTLGAEDQVGTRWNDIDPGSGRIAAETLAAALPIFQGLAFLSHGRQAQPQQVVQSEIQEAAALAAVVDAGRRVFDLVIVDLSRGDSQLHQSVVAQADVTVIAVRNHVRPVSAGAQIRQWVIQVGGSPHFALLVDSKGVSPADVGLALGDHAICEIPFVPSMCTRADEGDIPAMSQAYAKSCDLLLSFIHSLQSVKAA